MLNDAGQAKILHFYCLKGSRFPSVLVGPQRAPTRLSAEARGAHERVCAATSPVTAGLGGAVLSSVTRGWQVEAPVPAPGRPLPALVL